MASSLGAGKMVTDGLVLHLDAGNNKSYPGSGTVWTDLSQTAITGSLTNGPTYVSTNGGGIFFDGTNDFVGLGNPSFANITSVNNFTINVCFNAAAGNNGRVLVHKGATGFDYDYMVYITDNSTGLRFYKKNSSGTGVNSTGYPISSGSNINYCVVLSNDSISEYRDGILQVTSSITGDIRTTSNILNIGRGWEGSYSGSIFNVQIYNRALTANEVFQNYEATRERFNRPTIVTDDDARNFLNAAFISSETQQRAVNDLVVDMKNVGLWGKMKAIYPFVGGTAASHKWNLKDPRDVNAAFRLQFNGGWTHSSTGADPNGTTAWAETYLNPSTTLSAHSIGLTYYSRENTSGGTSIGADNNSFPGEYCKIRIGSGSNIGELAIGATNVGLSKFTVTNSAAYFIGSATNSTTRKMYRNGVSITFNSQETLGVNGLVNYSLPLARNGGALTYSYDNKECAFATIGDGLTDTDAANLYTIVQKYQTTLGRQV
jgi:hypothetical protein